MLLGYALSESTGGYLATDLDMVTIWGVTPSEYYYHYFREALEIELRSVGITVMLKIYTHDHPEYDGIHTDAKDVRIQDAIDEVAMKSEDLGLAGQRDTCTRWQLGYSERF